MALICLETDDTGKVYSYYSKREVGITLPSNLWLLYLLNAVETLSDSAVKYTK